MVMRCVTKKPLPEPMLADRCHHMVSPGHNKWNMFTRWRWLTYLVHKTDYAYSPFKNPRELTGERVNSFPPGAPYMCQWIGSALVHIMACHLFGTKPLSEPNKFNQYSVIVNWTPRNKLQWNFNQNTKLFIHKNASENIVCEMAAIFSRGDELIVC